MKTILVPTDFSENAENALNYAIPMANAFGANIELVHTFHLSQRAGMLVSVQERMRIEAHKDLKKMVKEYQDKMTNGNNMDFHLIRDYAPEGISYMAKKLKADVIVMGTKGASGLKGAIWGSVASRLIAITSIPVIAVPKYYNRFNLDRILLAIENPTFNDKDTMAPLQKLKKKSGATVTTFNMAVPITVEVDEETETLTTSDTIREISDDYHQSFDTDLKEGLVKYVNKNKVDMICMIRKERGFFSDLVHASATKKIIFDSPVPLLILYYREKK